MIPLIEKTLNITLYEGQRRYLLNDGDYWFGGRKSGKTMAYCIRLALSDGDPINLVRPVEYIDSDFGPPGNESKYSYWFRRFFMNVWQPLKDAGFPVREVRTKCN